MGVKKRGMHLNDKGLSERLAILRALWEDARVPATVRALLESEWEKVAERIAVIDEKAAKYDAALQKSRDRKARLAGKAAPSDGAGA